MNELEKAKEWTRYAIAAPTEMGRLNALRAALNESPKILNLVLRELKLEGIEQVLKWAETATHADNSWKRKEPTGESGTRTKAASKR